jgi:hypothetical protein
MSDQSIRAFRYFMQELWEAQRGLAAAYEIDTGDKVPKYPAFRDLTDLEVATFAVGLIPVANRLTSATRMTLAARDRAAYYERRKNHG